MNPLILYPTIGAASSFGIAATVNQSNKESISTSLATVAGAVIGLALTTFSVLQVTAFVSVGAFLFCAKAKRATQNVDFDVPLLLSGVTAVACACIATFGALKFAIGATICLGIIGAATNPNFEAPKFNHIFIPFNTSGSQGGFLAIPTGT